MLRNGDIFSSGSVVEEVTFQGKGGFKKSYHIPNASHCRKSTAVKENTQTKCFCEGKEGMTHHSS